MSPRQPSEVRAEREVEREDAVDPTFEDRREAAEVNGGDERQRVRGGDLPLLREHVLRHLAADQCRDLSPGLAAHRAGRQEPLDRSSTRRQDPLFEIHPLQDVRGDGAAGVAGRVSVAKHGIELDGIQVHDLALMPGVCEASRETLQDPVTERLRILMRVHGEHLHVAFPSTAPDGSLGPSSSNRNTPHAPRTHPGHLRFSSTRLRACS